MRYPSIPHKKVRSLTKLSGTIWKLETGNIYSLVQVFVLWHRVSSPVLYLLCAPHWGWPWCCICGWSGSTRSAWDYPRRFLRLYVRPRSRSPTAGTQQRGPSCPGPVGTKCRCTVSSSDASHVTVKTFNSRSHNIARLPGRTSGSSATFVRTSFEKISVAAWN